MENVTSTSCREGEGILCSDWSNYCTFATSVGGSANSTEIVQKVLPSPPYNDSTEKSRNNIISVEETCVSWPFIINLSMLKLTILSL